jgi:hypothetical protein
VEEVDLMGGEEEEREFRDKEKKPEKEKQCA